MIINLQEPGIALRPLRQSDAPSLARHANNILIWNQVRNYFPHPYALADAEAFIATQEGLAHPLTLGIVDGEACIGVIGAQRLQDVYCRSADFGYWLGEAYWGRGIATLAALAAAAWVFAHSDIVRLQSAVFAFNAASMRVLEKAGFHLDCIARSACFKNGILLDEYRYSLLAPGMAETDRKR
jgi:RimJ/RimL family protein N-acetyltransferase